MSCPRAHSKLGRKETGTSVYIGVAKEKHKDVRSESMRQRDSKFGNTNVWSILVAVKLLAGS
jgi:hypothetical protein